MLKVRVVSFHAAREDSVSQDVHEVHKGEKEMKQKKEGKKKDVDERQKHVVGLAMSGQNTKRGRQQR